MAELLKNKFSNSFVQELASKIKKIYPQFASNQFINDIFNDLWNQLTFKNRMRQITINLKKYLPANYKESLSIIDQVLASYPSKFSDITLLIFPDFVEMYGQNSVDWNLSIIALEKYTKYATSEFAVRQFIIKNRKQMMQQMLKWTEHQDKHVRRLASEGCRPQLPWARVLTCFKKDPRPVLEVLEKLKNDSSLYVRKSVANNLNDISKTHPHLVLELTKRWYGHNNNTDWIVKHGCRTLLKKGDKTALKIFGFSNPDNVLIENFKLSQETLYIGESITFSFTIQTKIITKIRLEYAIDFVKANGKQKRKIFQISQRNYQANITKIFIKKHAFVNRTTRKHYPGKHSLSLIVNGIELSSLNLDLLHWPTTN